MEIALFILYLAIFLGIFKSFHIERNTGLHFVIIGCLFLIKIVGACTNLYIHNHEYITNDVIFYQKISVNDLNMLADSPAAFFNEWLLNWGQIAGRYNFLQKSNMVFWNNLGSLFHIKFMTLSNIFSGGRLYVNVIFFNVCFFIGQLLLYKSFYMHQPQKKWLFMIVIFFIPSVVFWCSGIHKDGWILSAIGFLVYYTNQYLHQKKKRDLVFLLLSLAFIFLARYFYFLCLLPPFLFWIFTNNSNKKLLKFSMLYLFGIIAFFSIKYCKPTFDPMQLIVNRQSEFIEIRGYSDMKMPRLENNFQSFVSVLPLAINHIMIQPFYETTSPIKYKIAFIDAMFINFIIVMCLLTMNRRNFKEGMYLFLLFYALSVFLFIGYTVPNAGALVRYKSVFTAILLPSLIALSEMPWLNKKLNTFEKLFSPE